jgi:hypothetical protein
MSEISTVQYRHCKERVRAWLRGREHQLYSGSAGTVQKLIGESVSCTVLGDVETLLEQSVRIPLRPSRESGVGLISSRESYERRCTCDASLPRLAVMGVASRSRRAVTSVPWRVSLVGGVDAGCDCDFDHANRTAGFPAPPGSPTTGGDGRERWLCRRGEVTRTFRDLFNASNSRATSRTSAVVWVSWWVKNRAASLNDGLLLAAAFQQRTISW